MIPISPDYRRYLLSREWMILPQVRVVTEEGIFSAATGRIIGVRAVNDQLLIWVIEKEDTNGIY